ncbi:tonB-dependent receptor [Asticcacaulis biprosthecium C19]|uniref:TonB-dependent receptor n=1 Tax=Asticcacaulis biprosthecium C19 TaxID=715226 RepID=F4QIV9_9CAUL|nr:hypothetical protein [Asticcacaulis biprosthecium]EGF93022.1 tonB-dependent receptor [Asticcacaulis biprosthecium C19]
MNGNVFLRTSAVFLCIGIGIGVYMGATHDFVQAPTHAHLNLVGGVWMFLAGLFYNAHPQVSKRLTTIHYALSVLGLALFIPGVYGAQIQAPWYEPVVGIGSVLTAAQILMFTVLIFLATGKKTAPAE